MSHAFQSVLILGRQPSLGLAELESLYGPSAVTPLLPYAAGLTAEPSEINFARLGGSTRSGHVLAVIPSTDWKRVERELPKLVTELGLTLPDGKVQLGLSAYGLKLSPAKLNASALTLKKVLRSKLDRSVRVTPNNELELGTAQVLHNKLTGPTGIELILVATADGNTVVARTHTVQDIEGYSLRDRGRPKRDTRVGMLPPKLAQILVNVAAADQLPTPEKIVLDPFCGTGVLLQEAALIGFSVYGTDLEERMVDYSRANLDWLIDQTGTLQSEILLEPGDATSYTWDTQPDIVAGETYLGRPFTERPGAEVIAQTASEVNLILKKFLKNLHGQLAPGTRLCLAVPAWQTSPNRFKHLPLIDQIYEMGYNRVKFEHVSDENLLYYREDQIVARELLVVTRK